MLVVAILDLPQFHVLAHHASSMLVANVAEMWCLNLEQVRSLCKSFTDFKLEEALEYIGVNPNSSILEVPDSEFPLATLEGSSIVQGFAPLTFSDLIKAKVADLYQRFAIFESGDHSSENTRRELISPVLVAGALLSSSINLHAEVPVEGSRGRGKVDYAAEHRAVFITLTEAKKTLAVVTDAMPQVRYRKFQQRS